MFINKNFLICFLNLLTVFLKVFSKSLESNRTEQCCFYVLYLLNFILHCVLFSIKKENLLLIEKRLRNTIQPPFLCFTWLFHRCRFCSLFSQFFLPIHGKLGSYNQSKGLTILMFNLEILFCLFILLNCYSSFFSSSFDFDLD